MSETMTPPFSYDEEPCHYDVTRLPVVWSLASSPLKFKLKRKLEALARRRRIPPPNSRLRAIESSCICAAAEKIHPNDDDQSLLTFIF